MVGQVREYRQFMKPTALHASDVVEGESDLRLFTSGTCDADEVRKLLLRARHEISSYIQANPLFQKSLMPVPVVADAPEIVRHMSEASAKAGVGPMAAVAGAVAYYVGRELAQAHEEVIIENGGDLFIKTLSARKVLIHAGLSPFSERLALSIPQGTWGVCTSAGTVGHSLSFGRADAVVVVSRDTLLADAAATALGNLVKQEADIEKALSQAAEIDGIEGVVVILGETMGAWGNINLIEVG